MVDKSDEIVTERKSSFFGKWKTRHTITILTFFGQMVSYQMRNDLSLAIVAMVRTTNDNSTQDLYDQVCPNYVKENSTKSDDGEFYWSSEEQGVILGSFFWGYVATQIPGGILSERYGAKWVFGGGMLLTAIFHLLTPLCARWGKGALIFSRIMQGVGEGVNVPATQVLVANWAPPYERSKMGAFIYAGNQLGTVTAMILSGAIIHGNFLGGWPGVFYTFGTICIIWLIFWTFFVYSKPSEHPRISAEELEYIQKEQGNQLARQKVKTPWKAIFSSMAFWAILVAQIGNGWGLYTLLTELPTYLKNVLKFEIKDNSYLSALPYFTMFIISVIFSQIADYVRVKKILSTANTRKVANIFGHWGPAVALVGAAYSGCDRILTVGLLTIAVGLSGCVQAGYQINHIDIAPNHAGLLMGLCNSVANLAGIAAPYLAGVIIQDSGTLSEWRLVFFIAAGVYFFDNLFYIIFAQGEPQEWNDENYLTKEKEKKEKLKNEQTQTPT